MQARVECDAVHLQSVKKALLDSSAQVGMIVDSLIVDFPLEDFTQVRRRLRVNGFGLVENELSLRDLRVKLSEYKSRVKEEEVLEQLQLIEELSSQDWSKLNSVVALLWYKFDRVIDTLKSIDRNTQ